MTAAIFATFLLLAGPGPAANDLDLTEPTAKVEQIRGLRFQYPVAQQTIDRAALRHLLRRQMDRDLPIPVDDFMAVLRSLQLVDDGPDMLENLLDLYEAQILAFYDPLSHKYYRIRNEPASPLNDAAVQQAVAVHELVHALQDQRFDAGPRLEKVLGDWDAQLAYRSVLEGEASLVMLAALQESLGGSLDDLIENGQIDAALAMVANAGAAASAETPRYFSEEMLFPYVAGTRFVAEIYRKGGWKLVDTLHSAPPTTTEQVLDPALYLSGKTGSSRMPEAAPSTVLMSTPLGVFHWQFLLGEGAAAGWAGDRADLRKKPDGIEVRIASAWDTEEAAQSFAKRLRAFLGQRSLAGLVEVKSNEVQVVYLAPKVNTPAKTPAKSTAAGR